MEKDFPILVRSVDLRNLALNGFQNRQQVENEYQHYWWGAIPLGHCWRPKDKVLEGIESNLSLIWGSVFPALQFYCSRQKEVLFEELQTHWGNKQWGDFAGLMEMLLKGYHALRTASPVEVSLVICTRNRPDALRKCLDSLSRLSFHPKEILVVDNAPENDQTKNLVSRYPGVKYILESRKGLDHARNTGWRQATAPIVAYTDDDVRLHKDWLIQLVMAFDHPRVQAVTSLVFAEKLDTEAQVLFEKYWSFNRGYKDHYYDIDYFKKHLKKGVPAWEIGAGASMAFRRSALQTAGGFDPRLDVGAAGCNGDSEMWYRLMAEGWTIHYTPRAIAYHTHRQEKKELKKQIFFYLRGAAASMLVQHQRYGHRGNLYHLYKTLPVHYFLSLLLKIRYRNTAKYDTLFMEIKGYFSGIFYFYKHHNFKRLVYPVYQKRNENEAPLVSVIITTYNHAQYLPDSIGSVLSQTYDAIELIVVDDGSADHTRNLISHYPQVEYIFQENKGLAAARNKGLQNCNGDFIVFLDADDLLYPVAIEKNLSYAFKHPESAFVSGRHDRVDENKKLIWTYDEPAPEKDHYQALLRGNYIGMHAAVMYRREVFDLFLFDELLPACEDYDLYLRLAKNYPVFSHNKELAAYRIHTQNMSGDIGLMIKQVKRVLNKNKPTAGDSLAVESYHQGKRNWNRYYAMEIYRRMAYRYLYPGYKLTIGNFFFTLIHLPKQTIRFFLYKLSRKGWNLIKSSIIFMKEKIKQLLGYSANGLTPRTGKIRMGDMRRTVPFSREFGYDRGGPVDRYYIEHFLQENKDRIRGRVLEIGDNAYTRHYGGDRVEKSEVLYIDDSNPDATIIGDLSKADHIPSNQFDCIILTQTLHLIYDFQAAVRHCYRILKTGGTLLLTSPGISQIDYGEWGDTWYWSFTGRAISRLLTTHFEPLNIKVETHGNVLAATAFLYGMGQNEISKGEKDNHDPHYQVIITAKAIKN